MDIKTMYGLRTRKLIGAAILMAVFPDPGLIVNKIMEAKRFDRLIREAALKAEETPSIVVIRNNDTQTKET